MNRYIFNQKQDLFFFFLNHLHKCRCYYQTPENTFLLILGEKGTVSIIPITTALVLFCYCKTKILYILSASWEVSAVAYLECLGFYLSSDWHILYYLIFMPLSLAKKKCGFQLRVNEILGFVKTPALEWGAEGQKKRCLSNHAQGPNPKSRWQPLSGHGNYGTFSNFPQSEE